MITKEQSNTLNSLIAELVYCSEQRLAHGVAGWGDDGLKLAEAEIRAEEVLDNFIESITEK